MGESNFSAIQEVYLDFFKIKGSDGTLNFWDFNKK
jgi:hypothetical protein